MSDSHDTPRLPPEWLPEPLPTAEDPAWDASVRRILAAAEPTLSGLRDRARHVPWWAALDAWWRPAAALAAASLAGLLIVPPRADSSPSHDLTLRLLAAGGTPDALWETLGVPVDPVLALVALEDHSAFTDISNQPDSGEGSR